MKESYDGQDRFIRYLSAVFAGGELLALGVLLKHVITQAVPAHKLLAAHGAGQRGSLQMRHFCVDLSTRPVFRRASFFRQRRGNAV
jgi:hypothetical protein